MNFAKSIAMGINDIIAAVDLAAETKNYSALRGQVLLINRQMMNDHTITEDMVFTPTQVILYDLLDGHVDAAMVDRVFKALRCEINSLTAMRDFLNSAVEGEDDMDADEASELEEMLKAMIVQMMDKVKQMNLEAK